MKRVAVCGAFQASVTLRPGETLEQAAERAEQSIQRALDMHAKRFQVAVGVDFGDVKLEEKS